MPSFVKLAGVAAVGTLVGAVFLAPVQRRLIYLPSNVVPEVELVLPGADRVSFDTEDDLTLDGWFVPPVRDGDALTVIVFNGNGGNRSDRAALGRALTAEGYGVLLFDYRGYGTNPGSPTEAGLSADGRAAVRYVESRSDVDKDRIVYFGESLGAGVAIATARSRAPAALVLRSPFTSLPEAASVHFPFLPTSLLLPDRYPNESIIGDIEVPVLVVAGSADRTVPPDQSERVFEAAREPKRLMIVDGADHNDVQLSSGPQVVQAVVALIEETVAQSD